MYSITRIGIDNEVRVIARICKTKRLTGMADKLMTGVVL
jgi:hypothetical protein